MAWVAVAAALAFLVGARLTDTKDRHGPPAREEAGESF
jgi:hypothetical protein